FRQGDRDAARRAAHLLLPHTDALGVELPGLHRARGPGTSLTAHPAAFYLVASQLGLRYRGTGGLLRRQLSGGRRAYRQILPPRVGVYSATSRDLALHGGAASRG